MVDVKAIEERWRGPSFNLTFPDDGQKDVLALLNEVRRLQKIETHWDGVCEKDTLADRLRGVYRTKITDGLGATGAGDEPDNPLEHVRTFEVPPIQKAAADKIDALEVICDELKHTVSDLKRQLAGAKERELRLAKFAYDLGWNGHDLDDIAEDTINAFNTQEQQT